MNNITIINSNLNLEKIRNAKINQDFCAFSVDNC